MGENRVELLFDREKLKPLSIIVGGTESIREESSESGFRTRTDLGYFYTSGLLQSYHMEQAADYRLVKTFSGKNYFYFFGESVPILMLNINMSNGSLFVNSLKPSYVLDIIKFIDKGYLLYGPNKKETEIQPATISFNTFVAHGFILSASASGDAQAIGTVVVNIKFIVRKMISKGVEDEPNQVSELFVEPGATSSVANLA